MFSAGPWHLLLACGKTAQKAKKGNFLADGKKTDIAICFDIFSYVDLVRGFDIFSSCNDKAATSAQTKLFRLGAFFYLRNHCRSPPDYLKQMIITKLKG